MTTQPTTQPTTQRVFSVYFTAFQIPFKRLLKLFQCLLTGSQSSLVSLVGFVGVMALDKRIWGVWAYLVIVFFNNIIFMPLSIAGSITIKLNNDSKM